MHRTRVLRPAPGVLAFYEGRIEGFVAMGVEEVDTTAGLAGVDEDEESTT